MKVYILFFNDFISSDMLNDLQSYGTIVRPAIQNITKHSDTIIFRTSNIDKIKTLNFLARIEPVWHLN